MSTLKVMLDADQYRDLGRRDGEAAARAAVRVLAEATGGGRFPAEVKRRLDELDRGVSELAARGISATRIEAYRDAWRRAFDSVLDLLGAVLLAALPDDKDDEA